MFTDWSFSIQCFDGRSQEAYSYECKLGAFKDCIVPSNALSTQTVPQLPPSYVYNLL